MRILRYALVALGLLFIGGIGAAFGGYVWLIRAFDTAGSSTAVSEPVIIAPGSGVSQIAAQLVEAGVIDSSLVFQLGARSSSHGGDLKAGEYVFPAGASPRDVMDQIVSGRVFIHALTFPEGLTSKIILEKIQESPILDGELTLIPPEGSLLPNTYHVHRGESRDGVVARMGRGQQEAIGRLWPKRSDNLPFSTPQEAIVLASIVERETGIAGERPHIAGVFINRLRLGMPLQSDPTVIYGLSDGAGRIDRPLTRVDLQTPHQWNTYVHSGLPPSPISNPGIESLMAVLNPMETRDLYFVADGTGGHVFAETLEIHNANVRKWRQIQRDSPQ